MVSRHLFKDAWRCYSSPRPTWFSKWVRNQPNPRCTSWRLGWKGRTNSPRVRSQCRGMYVDDITVHQVISGVWGLLNLQIFVFVMQWVRHVWAIRYICLWWSAALCLFWSCFWQRDASVGVGVGGPTHDNDGSFTVECFFRSTWTFHLGCQKVAPQLGIQVHLAQMMARTGMFVLSGIWRTQRFHGRYKIRFYVRVLPGLVDFHTIAVYLWYPTSNLGVVVVVGCPSPFRVDQSKHYFFLNRNFGHLQKMFLLGPPALLSKSIKNGHHMFLCGGCFTPIWVTFCCLCQNLQVSGSLEYTDSYGEVAQVAEKRYVAEVPWNHCVVRFFFCKSKSWALNSMKFTQESFLPLATVVLQFFSAKKTVTTIKVLPKCVRSTAINGGKKRLFFGRIGSTVVLWSLVVVKWKYRRHAKRAFFLTKGWFQ